ncbi:MAG: hypothetical protein E7660_04835 [Ruminococcaceae bacterium]|nr:hypothetical protein [Oscillospiraceae bacterium]
MKKNSLITLLLSLVLASVLLFTLTSCGKTETPEEPDDTETNLEEVTGEEDTTEEAETFEQEIFGQGTESDPYLLTPVDMAATTMEIPAGGSAFYAVYRVGGKVFTINDADAYVICDGTTYNAENGVVTFKVPEALASEAVLFQIGNNGSAAKSFKIELSSVPGSFDAPVKVEALDGDVTVSIPEGTTQGYNYVYLAAQAGTIRFYMTSSVEAGMTVDRVRNESEVIQFAMDEEKVDAEGKPFIEVEVEEGDELRINVSAIPNKRGKYPAVDITWNATFSE